MFICPLVQARYLVERQDGDVYAMVLDEENTHRKAIIEQLVNTALPESKHPEMVSTCVKAFMAAGLQARSTPPVALLLVLSSPACVGFDTVAHAAVHGVCWCARTVSSSSGGCCVRVQNVW